MVQQLLATCQFQYIYSQQTFRLHAAGKAQAYLTILKPTTFISAERVQGSLYCSAWFSVKACSRI